MASITPGAQLLVSSGPEIFEVVTVAAIDANAGNFTATFAKDHVAPVSITLLGSNALRSFMIPRIIGGGDRGRYTKDAGHYYIILPFGMMLAWILILLVVIFLLFYFRDTVWLTLREMFSARMSSPVDVATTDLWFPFWR
jgi:hypothetical protein